VTCDVGKSNCCQLSKIVFLKLSVGGTVAVHMGQRELRVIEVASVELWHLNIGAKTIRIGGHTLTESRPTKCTNRCSLVAICSGNVHSSYPAGSTRHRRSCDLGNGTNTLDPITPPLLSDPCDARSTVRFRERFSEWSAT
jgi:hypothetical protein